ncbi:protein of unknown function [Ekhidna lutea]|uniref:DUF4249 domain-containing protein n=1 Tax=Ekhidna lutea TaxID=447679 RepID=A0A239K2A7_EKHLU|nr:DUF4249 domain-containing protein [Ekhidna lutea]SNT12517.1 protein of unknown function [Ekhidna lutea]
MKKVIYISLIFLFACEQVVVVDLPQPQKLVVLEGWISDDSTSRHPIRLTRSNAFSSTNRVAPIDDADVIVQARTGEVFNYSYDQDGYYTANSEYSGISGVAYRVLVFVDSMEVRSEWDIMPEKVQLNNIQIQSFQENDPDDPSQQITIYYPKANTIDPVEERNFYRWVFYKNEEIYNEPDPFTLQDDRLFNGNLIPNNFQNFGYDAGDEMEVQLISISARTHAYLSLLKSQITTLGTSGGTTPAIVEGNLSFISDDSPLVLGYFGAVSISSQKRTVR